jgi:hypothetical protein
MGRVNSGFLSQLREGQHGVMLTGERAQYRDIDSRAHDDDRPADRECSRCSVKNGKLEHNSKDNLALRNFHVSNA